MFGWVTNTPTTYTCITISRTLVLLLIKAVFAKSRFLHVLLDIARAGLKSKIPFWLAAKSKNGGMQIVQNVKYLMSRSYDVHTLVQAYLAIKLVLPFEFF